MRTQPLRARTPCRIATSRPLSAGSKAAPSITLICPVSWPRHTFSTSAPSSSRKPVNVAPALRSTRRHACSPGSATRASTIATSARKSSAHCGCRGSSQASRFHRAAFRSASVCCETHTAAPRGPSARRSRASARHSPGSLSAASRPAPDPDAALPSSSPAPHPASPPGITHDARACLDLPQCPNRPSRPGGAGGPDLREDEGRKSTRRNIAGSALAAPVGTVEAEPRRAHGERPAGANHCSCRRSLRARTGARSHRRADAHRARLGLKLTITTWRRSTRSDDHALVHRIARSFRRRSCPERPALAAHAVSTRPRASLNIAARTHTGGKP